MSHGHGASEELAYYGTVAEFESAEELLHAAEQARLAGYKALDAYTPFPVHGLSDAIGFRDIRVPWIIFLAAMIGGLTGYTLQWYTAVVDYPLNVGGKPLNSLPSFFPITFECTILFSAFTAVFSMLAINKLPQPYHSIFNTPGFDRASQDRFFLAIESKDPMYDPKAARTLLEKQNPVNVCEVPV